MLHGTSWYGENVTRAIFYLLTLSLSKALSREVECVKYALS